MTSCLASDLNQAEFFPGCKVLARKEADGFYYSGTVIKEVQVVLLFFLTLFFYSVNVKKTN